MYATLFMNKKITNMAAGEILRIFDKINVNKIWI
jgi:hypothetical protein